MVADLEVNLVRAALDGIADYEKLMAIEPARHEFDDEGAARAMSFVGEYVRQYGSLPSVDAVRETARVELPDKTGMVFDHWLGEFVERRVFRMTNRAIQQAYSLLEQNKGHEAFASMKAFVDEGLGRTVVKPPSTIFSHGRKVVERLREGRAGMVGIETP